MFRFVVASDNIRCPCCGSASSVLGAADGTQGRATHHCQCSECLQLFDRVVAPNGKGVTVLYALQSTSTAARTIQVVPGPAREGMHAS